MKTVVSTAVKITTTLLLTVVCQFALAAPIIDRSNPEKMLKDATDALLTTSKEARSYVSTDHARYYQEVANILNQVINKDYFSRAVMANYGSNRLYNSLQTDAEKQAFNNRIALFSSVMEKVLIEKYADVLLTFNGDRIDISTMTDQNSNPNKARLQQTIYNSNNQHYSVQYSMYKDSQNLWLISNVIVEGINLGETYRSQFSAAVEKNKGDVDYVINNWGALMQPVKVKNTSTPAQASGEKGE